MVSIRVSGAAHQDIENFCLWCQRQQPGIEAEFLRELA